MTSFVIGGVKPPFIYNHLPVAYVVYKGGQLTNLKSWLKHDRILGLTGLKLYHIQLKVHFYSLFSNANCPDIQNRFIQKVDWNMTWFWARKCPKFQFPESAILAAAAIGGVKPPFIYNHLPVAYVGHKGKQLTNLLKKLIETWQNFGP